MATKDTLNAEFGKSPEFYPHDSNPEFFADTDSLTVLVGKTPIRLEKINVSRGAVNYGDFATHIEMHLDFAAYVEAGRPDFLMLYV